MKLRVSVTGSVRTSFSVRHIQSAAYFSRASAKLEKSYKGRASDDVARSHNAYVTGSIFASIAFLEAAINEFFDDISDQGFQSHLRKHKKITLAEDKCLLMRKIWDTEALEKVPTLTKYQVAIIVRVKIL